MLRRLRLHATEGRTGASRDFSREFLLPERYEFPPLHIFSFFSNKESLFKIKKYNVHVD
jgi:hypothetical protein